MDGRTDGRTRPLIYRERCGGASRKKMKNAFFPNDLSHQKILIVANANGGACGFRSALEGKTAYSLWRAALRDDMRQVPIEKRPIEVDSNGHLFQF